MLVLCHPEVAYRDCGDCQKWLYDDSGARSTLPGTTTPIRRPPGTSTPCRQRGKGCPKGTPEAQKTLNEQNSRVYQHYLECKATGHFPDDPIVRHHAGTIRSLEEEAERQRHREMTILLRARNGGL